MKMLYRYYRWRAKKATGAKQEHFRSKAYKHTQLRWGLNLNQFPDPQAMRQELTAGINEPIQPEGWGTMGYKKHFYPGRYVAGREADGAPIWKETPAWWADSKEPNEQHMPTYRTPRSKATMTKLDPETGKRTYWKYNYKTGQQEEVK